MKWFSNFTLVLSISALCISLIGLRPCDRRSKRKGDFEAGKLPKSGVIGTELVQNYITK